MRIFTKKSMFARPIQTNVKQFICWTSVRVAEYDVLFSQSAFFFRQSIAALRKQYQLNI